MKLLPSIINGRERDLIKETEDGQEVFYYEDENLIIRNFLPEDATAWCVCMHPEFIRTPILKRKEILKDIRRRINMDLNPKLSSEKILEFTYMLNRKNGRMFGTLYLKEYPRTDKMEERTVMKLFIKDTKEQLELKTLKALKNLQEKYHWYDNITICQDNNIEISLDDMLKKFEK